MDIKSKNELRLEEEKRRMEDAKKAKAAPLASKTKTYTRPATDAVRYQPSNNFSQHKIRIHMFN